MTEEREEEIEQAKLLYNLYKNKFDIGVPSGKCGFTTLRKFS